MMIIKIKYILHYYSQLHVSAPFIRAIFGLNSGLDYILCNLYAYITIYQHNGDVSPENCLCGVYQAEKSAVAKQHRHDRQIDFSGILISDRTVDWLVKKATEIHPNKNHFNSDGDFMSSQAWSCITSMLMNEEQDKVEHVVDTAYKLLSSLGQLCLRFKQGCHDVDSHLRQVPAGAEVSFETLGYLPFNHLTPLLAREYFIEFNRH
jgi:hypothetical protein